MSKMRNRVIVVVIFLVAVIVWASYGMANPEQEEVSYKVSVIVDDSYNDRWLEVKEGLEQAASDNNILLSYLYTAEFVSVEEQLTLIEREVENGAQGIVVQFISSEMDENRLAEIGQKVKLVLLDSAIKEEQEVRTYSLVRMDDYGIGHALAEQLLADMEAEENVTEDLKIGVVYGYSRLISTQERLAGLMDTLELSGQNIHWKLSNDGANGGEALLKQIEQQDVDIIVTLGNRETELAIDYLQSEQVEGKNYLLYGEGYSEKAVYYLDKGVVRGMAVPNELNMGYQSIQLLGEMLRNETISDDIYIEFNMVNPANLYDDENQKVLFPIVQ